MPVLKAEAVGYRAARLLPGRPLVAQGEARPLAYLVALEFRQNRQHPEYHLAGGGRRVDPLRQGNEVGAAPIKGLGNRQRVLG